MRNTALFAALLGIDFLLLVLQIPGLSIGYHEAQIVYGDLTPLKFLVNLSFSLFGEGDYALRLPMLLLHLISVIFLYAISRFYVTRESDRLWILLIYLLLPGTTSAALVVNNAGLMIASLFVFGYLYLRYGSYALGMLPLLLWIDPAFAYLFLSVAVYGIYKRDYRWMAVGGVFFGISLYLFGIRIGGVPESRFLHSFGVYAAIFSPIVFIYLFYVLYRRMISREWDFIWTVSATAFAVSFLLSFRQKVPVQTFAPYLLLALPLAAQTFFRTYRVRLREFRGRYRLLFYSALSLLIINALAVFFNQWLYRFLDNPTRHFSYPMHVAKELAQTLKKENIGCIAAEDEKLQLRLRFYGITQCETYRLGDTPTEDGRKVTISYKNTPIYIGYVTKVNNKRF